MIKIQINLPIKYNMDLILLKAGELLRIPITAENKPEIIRLRLDTSDKNNIIYKATVALSFDELTEKKLLNRKTVSDFPQLSFSANISKLTTRPIVVGSGPAGLFSALVLAESGANPIVIERGYDVDKRILTVNGFNRGEELNEESNIQFGEGGAGTFSDGKLKYGALNKYNKKVLEEFIKAGAPENIKYSANAHVGTDKLTLIVKQIRKKIISLGGEFLFSSRVTNILTKNGFVTGAEYIKDGSTFQICSDNIVLATGHSARDVFEMLNRLKAEMQLKDFGVGVRIEHPQEHINKLVYGTENSDKFEPAGYKLVTHLKNGRSVYNFCMCPGGSVVAATSEKGRVVTNGMSNYSRNGTNANSALLVSVKKSDFATDNYIEGIRFQQEIEKAAFSVSSDYKSPSNRLEDFMNNKVSRTFGSVLPTYPRGSVFCSEREYLPDFVVDSLKAAVTDFENWMPGFYYPDAVLSGAETRSTSPVKIIRNDNLEAINIKGLYPCGEGAGYAGGIISSAVDGMKVAESILQKK